MLNFLLNKGGAGTSISRSETIERLNPLIRQHQHLLHSYGYAIRNVQDQDVAARLEHHQKTARADIGKLSESILSAGGTPYNGTDLEAERFDLGAREDDLFARLRDLEQDFHDAIEDESDINHQIRTQAILMNLHAHSRERLDTLDDLLRKSEVRSA